MGVQMELDFEKKCGSTLSCKSNIEKRSKNNEPTGKNDVVKVKESFTEISFHQYHSSSGKNDIELKRGSVYQTPREVSKLKKMDTKEERRKIELSHASDTLLSLGIVDSLCSSDEENSDKISPAVLLNTMPNLASDPKLGVEQCQSDGFIEICPSLDERRKQSTSAAGSNSIQNGNFICEQVASPLNDGNGLHERHTSHTFHKSFSAKVEMPQSPSPSESGSSDRGSSKFWFSPVRRMFDPLKKSKSLRSPLGYKAESEDLKTTGVANMRRNRTFQKSLLNNFSHTFQKTNSEFQHVKKDSESSAVTCPPAHLHACLKLENKQGVPFFEFSLKCPEEVFVAKTWKANNGSNWVYTFHSICSNKKTNAIGWAPTDGNKESLVVGQMQVSCYLCSELKDGVFDNSVVMEFVLYEIEHARKIVSAQASPDVSKRPTGSNFSLFGRTDESNGFEAMKLKHQPRHALDASNPYPCASAVLRPDLEIAAIVIQFPFTKRESLKYKRGSSDKMHLNLLNLSMAEHGKKEFADREISEKVQVVVPTGNHGLPSSETRGPSSLLDRWRLGGGCDCGGWDMGCPLTVFGNPSIQCTQDQPIMDTQQPLELFVQGTIEKVPALSMTVIEEGQYAVDFHAQLTTLQAFSICVAMLHGTEALGASGEGKSKQLPQCNSLKVLIEEEVKFLIEAVAEEEKKNSKPVEDIQQSYVINPPFSPIARV